MKHKKAKTKLPVIRYLVYLIVVTTVVTGVSLSRYSTSSGGNDAARVAKWDMNVYLNGENTPTEFTETKTLYFICESSDYVAEGKIAPGINASAVIEIDPAGTEVAFDYEIELGDFIGKPDSMLVTVKANGTPLIPENGRYSGTVYLPAAGAMTADQKVIIAIELVWPFSPAGLFSNDAELEEIDRNDTNTGENLPDISAPAALTVRQID